MFSEVLQDIVLIAAGRATDGVVGRIEFDTTDRLTQCTGGSPVLVLVVY
jgi:hypothetical protein